MARLSLVAVLALAACKSADKPPAASAPLPRDAAARIDEPRDPPARADDLYAHARDRMVTQSIEARGISDPRVLAAMRAVPRDEFVPPDVRAHAYDDSPLPIGFDMNVSQPYIVAAMTEAAHLAPGNRVLEIGTGSGYQAAVLAAIGCHVYTIEINDALAKRTGRVFAHLGFDDIQLRVGDGYFGWPQAAPFDAIIVTAAAPQVPAPLIAQLKTGGVLVIPIGDSRDQALESFMRGPDGLVVTTMFPVLFSRMIGEATRHK